jgi:outer membrane protein assembly factor BamB
LKFIRQVLSNKKGRYIAGVSVLVLLFISNWISNQPEPKTIRQIGASSEHLQTLWIKKIYLWDPIADWSSNTIFADDHGVNEKLFALDSLTGSSMWYASMMEDDWRGEFSQFGVSYLLAVDKTVFTVTSTNVNAYRASTGELLWFTKLGDGHVSIYPQVEGSLLRIYYGNKIFEVSQATGKILNVQPKNDIVWIQNNVEIHCPLTDPEPGAAQNCVVGLTGINRLNGKRLWVNSEATYSEVYQEQAVNNLVFVEVRGGKTCALNPDAGGYTWCLPDGKISNIAIDSARNTGYFLRNDFSLVKIDLPTGAILAETQFLPKVFPAEMQKYSYGYIVAVTKDTVIVSFGDSDQTFGLKNSP